MLIQYKANGMQRDVRDPVARALIRRNLARAVHLPLIAQREAQPPLQVQSGVDVEAPYGRKADGTPRARPGRKASDPQPEEGTYNRRDMRAED